MIGTTSGDSLVTFALLAFNQEAYIREAVEGALSQTYEPLEIILSDDCSNDRTYEIMQEVVLKYDGPHEVRVRRNEINLGLTNHVNLIMSDSRGEILLLAAGDDVSLPDRSRVSVDLLKRNPSAVAVLLSAYMIDKSGTITGESRHKASRGDEYTQTIHDLLSWQHTTFGATRAIRREVFSRFGPLNADCPTEDTTLLVRSLMCGSNIVSSHKGILYRRHEKNLSRASSLMTMDITAIYQQYKEDMHKAKSAELITDKLETELQNWMNVDRRVRIIKLNASLNKKISLHDVIFYLQHPSAGFLTKVKFLTKYLMPFKVFN